MVSIPPGRFSMGSEEFYAEEAPVREVEVDSFAIQRCPVTVAEFADFVADTGYRTVAEQPVDERAYPGADPALLVEGSAVFRPTKGPVSLDDPGQWWVYVPGANWRHPWGPDSDNGDRAEHPVTHVAYEDALAYAAWAGMELPSEAEWEYAARGGLDGARFAWGDEERPGGELRANSWQGQFPWHNTGAKGWRGTSPVGRFEPNGYGLYDVTGNVWEWTSDEYSITEASESACCGPRSDEPDGPGAHFARRVIKGGSHLCAPNYCLRYRPAARQPQTVDTSTSHVGFRCLVRGDG